jgi:hypothetical protein
MGANIEANTINQEVLVDVIIDNVTVTTLHMQHPTQSIKPYAWPPVAGYEFQVQLVLGPATDALQLFKINWLFEVWPDATARKYPFMNYGDPGAKFIQGIVMPVETGGSPAEIGLFSDDTNQTYTWTKTTQPLVKTGTVFNIEQPFIAHELQWQTFPQEASPPGNYSIDAGPGARIWPAEAKVVWEPIPELTATWQTQQSSWDFPAWWSLREAYIAYMGGGGVPTLSITTEYSTINYALPAAINNQYQRAYLVLQPQKSKWKSFRVDCEGGIRLFQKDCVVFAKAWGSSGPYIGLHPFGGQSNTVGAAM